MKDEMTKKPKEPNDPLLSIRDLRVAFRRGSTLNQVVHGVDLDIGANETVALVGESGSGKTVTASSILRLLPSGNVKYPSGNIYLQSDPKMDLLSVPEQQLLNIRGNERSEERRVG